jgi:hypothetical protein
MFDSICISAMQNCHHKDSQPVKQGFLNPNGEFTKSFEDSFWYDLDGSGGRTFGGHSLLQS